MTDAPSPRCSSGTNEPFGYLIEKAGVRNGYYFVSTAEFACVEERFQHLYKPISETPLTGDILRRYLRGSEALAAEARATGETEASALDRLVEIADRAHSSPAPQIAGGVREALAIKLLGVNPDTLRWADYGYETQQHYLKMADVAIAALSLQAQAGGVAQARPMPPEPYWLPFKVVGGCIRDAKDNYVAELSSPLGGDIRDQMAQFLVAAANASSVSSTSRGTEA